MPSPLSPTHTDTHASLYNGCFTLVPERERPRQREGDMVRRRKGDVGEGGYWKKKETAMRYRGEKGAEENASEIKAAESRQV